MYDLIIIGAGPAGLTSAIYAIRREMKVLVIGEILGGQMIWASEFENYPGYKSISAGDLITNMAEQVKGLGVEIVNQRVSKIEKKDNNFKIITNNGGYSAKTIILNLGADPRKLNIPGEKEFTGRGVSYCANCDGQFFKNKDVVVVGGGNSAIDAAEVMSKIASKVYVVNNEEKFTGFEALVEKINGIENIEVMHQTEVKEIIGEKTVDKIKIQNKQTSEEKELVLDGVFIEIGYEADTDWLGGLVEVDKRKQIIVDAKCQTSLPGVFAAGDVTNVPYKQIVIACGQGAIAALSAYEYLQLK